MTYDEQCSPIKVGLKVMHVHVHLCVFLQQNRAVPAQMTVFCPQQIRITNFYYHHLCPLHNSRTNINLFLSFLLVFCIQTRISKTWITNHCRNHSTHCSTSLESIVAYRTGPCPLRFLLPSGGLGLHKTYKSCWERSTPESCLC